MASISNTVDLALRALKEGSYQSVLGLTKMRSPKNKVLKTRQLLSEKGLSLILTRIAEVPCCDIEQSYYLISPWIKSITMQKTSRTTWKPRSWLINNLSLSWGNLVLSHHMFNLWLLISTHPKWGFRLKISWPGILIEGEMKERENKPFQKLNFTRYQIQLPWRPPWPNDWRK